MLASAWHHPHVPLDPDRPILAKEQDLLGRRPLVARLADWVRDAPLDEGFVIGLTGPWGSGKTSVLNLLEESLESEAIVVWFEPWLFSDADQLVTRFFDELSAQLKGDGAKRRLRKLGTRLADYGAALSPAASVVLGPAGQIAGAPKQLASMQTASASAKRREIRAALRKHPQRIVVLIDDLDRLDPHEVGEVLRLAKLVADLPGVVHVLSYDRPRVERALAALGIDDGNAYLQKIVQASMGVPPIPRDQLRTMGMDWLQQALGERDLEPWDPVAWSGLLDGGVDGYLQTLRDGRRLANMAPAAIDLCGDEVAGMDVLALDAIRIFDPNVHEGLPSIADILVGNRGLFEFRQQADVDKEQREKVEAVLSKSSSREPARHLLLTLFPAAGHLLGGMRNGLDPRWRTLKRVASGPVLMRYLHHTLGPTDAASASVDAALAALSSSNALESLLAAVEDDRLADLVDRIRARLGEQGEIDVLGCSRVVLALSPRLRPRPRALELDPTRRALWLVDDLLETRHPPEARKELMQQLVAQAPTLSLRVQLLYRYRARSEDAQRPQLELLDETTFAELAALLTKQVIACPTAELATEANLLWLFGLVQEASGQEAALDLLKAPELLAAVLEQVGTEVRPQSDGGVSINVQPLVRIAGEGIIEALQALAQAPGPLDPSVHTALRHALNTYAPADESDHQSDDDLAGGDAETEEGAAGSDNAPANEDHVEPTSSAGGAAPERDT